MWCHAAGLLSRSRVPCVALMRSLSRDFFFFIAVCTVGFFHHLSLCCWESIGASAVEGYDLGVPRMKQRAIAQLLHRCYTGMGVQRPENSPSPLSLSFAVIRALVNIITIFLQAICSLCVYWKNFLGENH